MNSKNIFLIVICLLCGFFIFTILFKDKTVINPLSEEKVKCDLIADWLKKKNVSTVALYGNSETLMDTLENIGIKTNREVVVNFEKKIDDFFNQVKSTNSKAVIFNNDLKNTDSIEEILAYLKAGGVIYFRNISLELIDNDKLFEAIAEGMKKGQICLVLNKSLPGNTQSLSIRDKVLAENIFFDDSNFAEFDKWYSDALKRKAEFLQSVPPN